VFTDSAFNLNLADVFLRNITLHMNGFANVQPYLQEAIRLVERAVIDPRTWFTHQFALADIDQAFATFHQKRYGAMKVLVRP
jgi:alcohol dehydrogenase